MSLPNIPGQRFVICLQNSGYPASLEVRKVYQVVPDETAAQHQLIRVIDESGEHYLYPEAYFVRVELPESVREMLAATA